MLFQLFWIISLNFLHFMESEIFASERHEVFVAHTDFDTSLCKDRQRCHASGGHSLPKYGTMRLDGMFLCK